MDLWILYYDMGDFFNYKDIKTSSCVSYFRGLLDSFAYKERLNVHTFWTRISRFKVVDASWNKM